MTSIGSYAFENCTGLTSVTIGNGIKTIGSSAFASCPEQTDVYCYAENVPSTGSNAFQNSYIEYATLLVPTSSIDAYKAKEPWKSFKTIMGLDGTMPEVPETPETPKCATPTISYANDKLVFDCDTEGAEFVSEVIVEDNKKSYTGEVELTKAYNISVYATKTGYNNSDVATAILTWIDVEPRTGNLTTGVNEVQALPVLIKTDNGVITVTGADDGMKVEVFGLNGVLAGSAHSYNGTATVSTTLQAGTTAIVKIGERSVKVVVK